MSIESLSVTRDDLTLTVFNRFRELAGSSPTFFVDRGESMTSRAKERLVAEIRNNVMLEREVRFLAARLEFLDLNFSRVIARNDLLSTMLNQYLQTL